MSPSEDTTKQMMDMFTNPLFKIGFFDFFLKMQAEGIDAARKFWLAYADKNAMVPNNGEMFERMVDFYITLGFVPRVKYEDALKENKNLKAENKFLRDAMHELQQGLFNEIGEKGQQMWDRTIDNQLELNKEITRNFFEVFRQLKVGSR